VNDALFARGAVKKSNAELLTVLADFLDHRLRQRIAVRLGELVSRNNVIDRREGAVRHRDLQFQIAQHAESLRAGHLVDEVRADQQLRLAVGQLADGVSVPYFLEERFCHGDKRDELKNGRAGPLGPPRNIRRAQRSRPTPNDLDMKWV